MLIDSNLSFDRNTLCIVDDIDEFIEELKSKLPLNFTRVIKNSKSNDFLILDANNAIKEAYIASDEIKYIILCGEIFRNEAQNALLKILEETLDNIVFILVTNSKSTILPTIISRLFIKNLKKPHKIEKFELSLKSLELKDIYDFLNQHKKISKEEGVKYIESILYSINIEKINLDTRTLDKISNGIKLLHLNSDPKTIITSILLEFN